jgi:hypothetical protein
MGYVKSGYDLEQRLTKSRPIVCIVQLGEEQSGLKLPLAIFFFNP